MPATNAPAGLAAGTGTAVTAAVATTSVSAGLATAAGSALGPGTSATSSAFPARPLGIRVDLLLGGTWTDITQYVLQRNDVHITGMGRADWTSTIQAAQLTLTLKNTDGRFTPKLSTGAYYPNIVRNTQIRVFLSVTSSAGISYAGFRYYGEVAEWPLDWDPSQHDVTVNVVASGIWRRLSQLQTTLGSAYRRYVVNTAAATGLRSYWPMEDGSGSGQLVPYGSAAGTGNAIQSFLGGQAGLSMAASAAFRGSDAIPVLNAASIVATVPAGGTPTNNVIRFGISVPAAGDSAQGTTAGNLVEVDTAGTVRRLELYLNPAGTLMMQGVSAAGAVVFAATTTTNVHGQPYLVSMELTPSGGNIAFALRIIVQGAAGITESVTGTLNTASVGAVSRIAISRANVLMDTAIGHLAVAYGTPTSLVQAAGALNGYVGERALDRFTRLCGEMGIAAETIGTSSATAAMGPQLDDTLANVLQMIEDTDCGLLYETRDQFGLGYRANATMANQVSAVSVNYAAATIDQDLATAYDDQLTRNNITVSNWTGVTQQAILSAGAMSVLNPPAGIGNGYGYQRNVSAAADTQLPGIATFLLNTGSSDEIRLPVITFKMMRASSAPFFSVLPSMDIGDYFQIANPPAFLTGTAVKQLMWGYSETLNAKQWTFSLNTVPETPWETGVSPGTIQIAQIPGGSAVSSQAPGAGSLSTILNGSITPAMLNQGITIHTLGGNAVTIAATAPPNPNLNDIWIASATGLISQWNGSAWAPVLFNATNTIQAGTIISSLIAAGTIVATNIAAGTITAASAILSGVFAGIVDATNVFANTYVATSAGGEFLAYDVSAPTTGHLVNSIAGSAGTDSVSNAYPAGLFGQQLTLANQGSAPASFAGSSVLYSSVLGRLRYLSSSGADLVLDRSALNIGNFTMSTQTIPHVMSGALSYLANEAVAGSEYEVEMDGTFTSPTGGAGIAFSFDYFIDGAAFIAGTALAVGSVVVQTSGSTYAYTVRYRASILTTGAGGTCIIALDGGVTLKGGNAGNTGRFTTLNNVVVNAPIDTTANHSLAIYCNWGSTTGTGHSAITYRTKITRRN